MTKASDCKCIICGKQAVAFWPVIDPDIPSHPYCRKCLDKEKLKAMIGAFGEEQGPVPCILATMGSISNGASLFVEHELNELNELKQKELCFRRRIRVHLSR